MTENKRFINDIDDGKLIDTKGELSTIHYSDKVDFYELWEFLNKLNDENEELKQQLKLKEAKERINCRNCIYFILGSSSDSCLKREDIGYKGTCIDGMDYHYLAKNCPYYEKGDVE